MQLFECQACGQPLYFENVVCGSCGRRLGYLPKKTTITALEPDGEQYKALADPEGRYFTCANLVYESCNWLIPADSGDTYCVACRHNRTIPDLSDKRNLILWRRIEVANTGCFIVFFDCDCRSSPKCPIRPGWPSIFSRQTASR